MRSRFDESCGALQCKYNCSTHGIAQQSFRNDVIPSAATDLFLGQLFAACVPVQKSVVALGATAIVL